MSRVPGLPSKKLTLLSRVDQKTLPHLVADILYFLYRHHDVRVLDGPGDGKRDVHSVQPNGSRYIAQCKYHKDTNIAASSDETDELIIALTKFGCKAGLFVTTGKISPQAKREYLDNYPGFQLGFIDGLDLVDTVLASPILSAVWFDGACLTQVHTSLYVPFILRTALDDRQIEHCEFVEINDQSSTYKFNSGSCHKLDFEPYRPPSENGQGNLQPDHLRCNEVLCSGTIRIHNIPEQLRLIANVVERQIADELLPVIIRFGVPSLTATIETSPDDRVKITRARPQSFIITKNHAIINERDWVVISRHDDWDFPKNLSVAEADWAGWLNRSMNTIFMQELGWPAFGPVSFFTRGQHQLRQQWLEQSLFISGINSEWAIIEQGLSEEDHPNWTCPYGPGGILLCWAHPALDADEYGNILFRYTGKDNKFEGIPQVELELTTFQERIQRVSALCAETSLSQVPFDQARFIAAAAGVDLLPPPQEEGEFRSAELVHYYEDIPSPVYLQDRRFLFVRMWQIPTLLAEVRDILKVNTIDLGNNTRIYWDAKLGPRTKKTFLLSTLMFLCPSDLSADEYFEAIRDKRDLYLEKLAEHVHSLWDNAELSTEFFWRTEVGFQIDDKQFRGNPWVILESKNDEHQIILINEDS